MSVVLLRWSERVDEDFRLHNIEIAPPTHDMVGIANTLHQQTLILARLEETNRRQVEAMKSLEGTVSAQQSEIITLKEKISNTDSTLGTISKSIRTLVRKLGFFRMPPSSPESRGPALDPPPEERPAKCPVTAATDERPVKRPATDSTMTTLHEPVSALDDDIEEVPLPSVNESLRFGAEAAAVSSSKQSNKDVLIETIIPDLYKGSQQFFVDETLNFATLSPPNYITDQSKFEATMELVEQVVDKEQRAELQKRDLVENCLLELASAIGSQCLTKMCEYDEKGDQRNKKSRAKSTYLALGQRVKVYKRKNKLEKLEHAGRVQSRIGSFFGLRSHNHT